jgi:ubiquitin-conjugating enzyme E2 N
MFANYGSIQALLSAPNPDDPLADNITKHLKSDEAKAVATGQYLNSHQVKKPS